MSEQPTPSSAPEAPDSSGFLAAALTAGVALAFCLVVVGLLIANAAQAKHADPLAPAQIELLKAELGADPANDAIRAQIRDLDTGVRVTYFVSRARAVQGTYLLAIGIAAFLLSAHTASKLRAKLPMPDPELAGRSWVEAALGLRAMVALGLLMSGFLLAMLMFARHDASAEYIREAREMEAEVVDVEVADIPDAPLAPISMPAAGPPAPAPVGGGAVASIPPAPPPLSTPAMLPGGGMSAAAPPPAPNPTPDPTPGPAPAPTGGFPTAPADPAPTGGFPTAPSTPVELAPVPDGWPSFRGPASGRAQDGEFPTKWDAESGDGILWEVELPLPGNSSPVFAGGRIFLTGADEMTYVVYCVDADSGELLWQQPPDTEESFDDPEAPEPPQVMEDTGYAAPTMATDGERVFAMFATGDVLAYDLDGEFLWFRGLGPLENAYGHAASLAVHDGKVIVQIDQGHDPKAEVSALVGLDALTGEIAWRTPRPVPNSWSSPVVVQVGDQYQIITTADPWVIAYDAEAGKELWRTECLMGDVGPSVAYANGIVYAVNDMSDLTAIRASAADGFEIGDIVWTGDEGLPDTSSPATNGELVFIVSSYGTVTCYDAATGAKVWDQDLDATFQSSPVIAGPNIYLADADGVTHIFEAAREYKAVGSGSIAEMIAATPAFIGGRIYLRGETRLYCIGTDETEE